MGTTPTFYDESNPTVMLLRQLLSGIANPAGSMPGVPLTSPTPFFRMGEPFILKVAPDSASIQQAITLPPGATTFEYRNNNPFAVRLCGTKPGQPFVPVTKTTGWLWLPATQAVRTTLGPAFVSIMSVDGPYASTSPEQKAGTGTVELQYGTGY